MLKPRVKLTMILSAFAIEWGSAKEQTSPQLQKAHAVSSYATCTWCTLCLSDIMLANRPPTPQPPKLRRPQQGCTGRSATQVSDMLPIVCCCCWLLCCPHSPYTDPYDGTTKQGPELTLVPEVGKPAKVVVPNVYAGKVRSGPNVSNAGVV